MVSHAGDLVAEKVRAISKKYLAGRLNPIEAALELKGFRDARPTLPATIFDTFDVISSETDAIPVGEMRGLWHPGIRAIEDLKHDRAQEWARPLMDEACAALLSSLPER
jgi:hypothetical protein